MIFCRDDLRLYAVTDRAWLGTRALADVVEEAVRAGVTFVQIREKGMGFDEFVEHALAIKAVTDRLNVPFVVNDDIEVALAVDADGVHVGQSDLSAANARSRIGAEKILGVSAQTVEQALLAERQGADYIGVGAVFPTNSKDDADAVSLNTLTDICNAVKIPVVAIGGINANNIEQLTNSGIAGVAVISAIFAATDITHATENMAALAKGAVE